MAAWQDELVPAELTYEAEPGKPMPMRDHPFIKDTPDVPTLLKRALDTHHEVGRRIPLNVDKTKPEEIEAWRNTNLPRLYDAGVLVKPPADAKEYEITKPDELIDGLTWSDERAARFGTLGIKHGLTKAAMDEFRQIHMEALTGTQSTLKLAYDTSMAALKREFGDKFEPTMEDAKRLTKVIFKGPEELAFFDETKLGNHPGFLGVIMRLSQLAKADSSLVEAMSQEGAKPTGDEVRAELADIMSNPNNPKNKLYYGQDKTTLQYVEDLYRKAYGDAKIVIN
jgi:hypothetical protein